MLFPFNFLGSSATPLLLDVYPSAAAAYSVRKLRTAYTGSAIRVRRSSDNAEQDIGFVGGELDTTALTTFVGANNGFVTTWYDQSGNARNGTQTTAVNQPQIVSSGIVLTINGKARLDFDGTNDSFNLTLFTYTAANYNSFVGRRNLSGRRLISLGGISYLWCLWSSNQYILNAVTTGQQISTATDATTAHLLLTGLRDASTAIKMYKNGVLIASSFSSTTIGNSIESIGKYTLTNAHSFGELQEIVYYNSAQESNRTGIEADITAYYGI
jgi:hypothetical protein